MSVRPEWVFETTDYEGTPIVLSRATWQAKAGNDKPGTHPEIRGYLKDVQAAIESPDLVFQSTRDERSRIFYRLDAGREAFAGKHMAENRGRSPVITVQYDDQADILTFTFTAAPQPAVAEEAADEVWVRYDPQTRRVITVDVLNFSVRVRAAFGPTLTYTERTDPQRLEALYGLSLPAGKGDT